MDTIVRLKISNMPFEELRIILGDQLNEKHSWLEEINPNHCYLLMETLSETNYVNHQRIKVIAFFKAMRIFADRLRQKGHNVHYILLDDETNQQDLVANILMIADLYAVKVISFQDPDEYRLEVAFQQLSKTEFQIQRFDSEHFMTQREDLNLFFKGKKTYLMENFYRSIRKKFDLLMEEDGRTPIGGIWNYDKENRKKLPKDIHFPPNCSFPRRVEELDQLLIKMNVSTIGPSEVNEISMPLSREEALELLDHFLHYRLHNFGTYEDAMSDQNEVLFHSNLSFAMNIKLIHPLEIVQKSIAYYYENSDKITMAQIEGFVRQIIGWREFMRGIYWAKMPEFKELNYFNNKRKLPKWYWTGKTKMKCLSHSIGQSLNTGYAHHIQRLMVIGNFALLYGGHPDEVDAWYLGVYNDAVEWVQLTNTRGMSQFADGGIVGSKPYVSSANYIHKMSDYCSNCTYLQTKKIGENACPFNSLYWDFYERNRDLLERNPRIGMMYRILDKMKVSEKDAILKQAQWIYENIEEL
jgi:deoxyribodipyrimidine photolyase-related protein